METILFLRKVEESDKEIIYKWINDPVTRANSFNQEPVSYEDHEKWFEKKMLDPDCHHYILMAANSPAGVLRLDRSEEDGNYVVSINLSPLMRGRGYASEALKLLCGQALAEIPDARILHAEVKKNNVPSCKAFEKAGFSVIYNTGGEEPVSIYEYRLERYNVIYFRCDGGGNVGAGHIMRCLSIADACRKEGLFPVFLLAGHEMESFVRDRGYIVSVLETPYDILFSEIPVLIERIPDESTIVIDSYFVTDSYISSLNNRGYCIILLDDTGEKCFDVDCIINYNIYAAKEMYGRNDLRLLMGPSYAPIRSSFCGQSYNVRPELRRILITTGAGDPYHICVSMLQGFLEWPRDLEIQVICGKFNPDREILSKVAETYAGRVSLITDVNDLSEYMRGSDFLIAAAGSTIYEACAIGIPMAVFTYADNQIPGAEAFAERVGTTYLGDYREQTFELVHRAISTLEEFQEADVRQTLSDHMHELVDGEGASRIARILYAYTDN